MAKGNILSSDLNLMERWGWQPPRHADDFPFNPQPPLHDPAKLASFFSGRQADLRRAVRTLFYGENTMVRGSWGIGKTAFMLTLLQRLHDEAKAAKVRILPIYVPEFKGADVDSFYRAILYAIARNLAPEEDLAGQVLEAMTGIQVSKERRVKGGAKIAVKVTPLAGMEGFLEAERGTARELAVEHPMHFIEELLALARKRRQRLVIAVDDLDKNPDQGGVQQMLQDAKVLLRNADCTFVLTGRPLVTVWEDFSGLVLEIFRDPIRLDPLGDDDLRRAAVGQLNTIRRQPADHMAPFTDGAMDAALSNAHGIPRLFNKLCRRALEFALEYQQETITENLFTTCLSTLRDEISVNVPYEVKRVLYRILRKGGVVLAKDEDVEDVLDAIGVNQLWHAIPQLNEWVMKDWLVPVEQEGRFVLVVSSLAERAAEEGREEQPSSLSP